ncbi:MAG TPA: TIM44-like domain-containing protein [Kofleriaceae bacterium]|nr:TIM44-like domain-containing protein [Kofleriaceae bacterium]
MGFRGLLIASLLVGGLAEARPGGGGSYRSSGSRSSSSSSSRASGSHGSSYSSSGSSGGSSLTDDEARNMLIVFGGIAVIFALIVLVGRRNQRRQRAGVARDDAARQRALAALKARDPGFDEAKFAARARTVMAAVNAAWTASDMRPARALISDGVFVRFQTQLALLKRADVRNVMADWQAVSAEVVAAESDALWDTLHVKMVGRARDTEVAASASATEASAAARAAELEDYEEVWSFVRRRGQTSHATLPALEGKCPGCGATVVLSETVKCTHCKGLLNSGEHDWVLAEITQPEAWDPERASGDVPGLEALRAQDPAVSRQALEDRASMIFWKWIAARATGERHRLDRFCLQPGVPALSAESLRDVAVGACELSSASAGDGLDRVTVAVTWSGATGDDYVNATDLFTLARASGVRSSGGLASLDCPTCGGALAESDDAKCRWCGEALSGGRHEWALEAVARAEERAVAA